MLKWVSIKLGWCFCEVACWWFKVMDHPIEDEHWKWWHYFTFFMGSIPMMIGCFFYGIAGEKLDE
tara:strand:+ start:221 stop:415 length:195 start_codon:yes stop_codon:yes gene_type:complete